MDEEKEMMPFMYGAEVVRTIDRDGEPWFVAKDVADILGYQDAEHMTRRLDDDETETLSIFETPMTGDSNEPNEGRGGARRFTIINESGLYNAILGSKKPEAKAFKKWVTSVVLPTIRRTGGYNNPQKQMEDFTNALLERFCDSLQIKRWAHGTMKEFMEPLVNSYGTLNKDGYFRGTIVRPYAKGIRTRAAKPDRFQMLIPFFEDARYVETPKHGLLGESVEEPKAEAPAVVSEEKENLNIDSEEK